MSTERLDPAAQPERTMLSWTRTALLLFVGGMLFFRASVPTYGFTALTVLGFASVVSAVLAVSARRRGRAMWDRIATHRPVVDRTLMAATAALATVWSVACAGLVLARLLSGVV